MNSDGTLKYGATSGGTAGARPSINLKSNVEIIAGSGSLTNPYRLREDSHETINGTTLLSTRYSGEYITFNNELYRIVGIENNLTKITAVNTPTTLSKKEFHSKATSFANANIKTDLQTYYENNVVEPYKSMVAENQTRYLGKVGTGDNYKASICKKVDAKISASDGERTNESTTSSIALPRVGEMFTSHIARETNESFWTLTPAINSSVNSVTCEGEFSDSVRGVNNARPSMYLKSNIRIASSNTGDGTYGHPYDIESWE